MINDITREEWLHRAVEKLNTKVFKGDLDILDRQFRVTWGKCPGVRKAESAWPDDTTEFQDFFPITLSVSYTNGDPIEMLTALAYECVRAFFDERKMNKRFKSLLGKYYFEAPFSSAHASSLLSDLIRETYDELKTELCPWENIAKPVVFPKKDKDKQKNTLTLFCPSCGLTFRVNRKKFEKAGSKLPTCGCGAMMGVAYDEEEENEATGQE